MDFDQFHQTLLTLYDSMMPLCGNMIGVAKGIAGLGALFYVAYRDINRTLGNFYEKPKNDPEKEEMKRKLEELEAKMQEKENAKNSMEEQLALMEKSYEMAAKYMPQQNQGEPFTGSSNNSLKSKIDNYGKDASSKNGKTTVSPVRQIQKNTVSSLAQNISNNELYRMYDQPRNASFNTMGEEIGISSKNTIAAVIHDDQTVIDGQTSRMRLTEPLVAGTTLIPENTILTGVAKIQSERLDILISSIEYQGTIIPVEMVTYDTDGQKGIHIPGSLEMNAGKEIIANMGSSVGSSFTMTQSAGAQLTSDLSKGAIQGVSIAFTSSYNSHIVIASEYTLVGGFHLEFGLTVRTLTIGKGREFLAYFYYSLLKFISWLHSFSFKNQIMMVEYLGLLVSLFSWVASSCYRLRSVPFGWLVV